MSDEISDGTVDVVDVLTEQIEARFGLSMEQLKATVAAAPDANPDATDIVRWHGLLLESQTVLDRAEHDLMVVLETQPDPVADRTHALVRRVEAAVVGRDGRAQTLRWYLDPGVDVPQRQRSLPLDHCGAPSMVQAHGAAQDQVARVGRRVVQPDEGLFVTEDVDEAVQHARDLGDVVRELVHPVIRTGGHAQAHKEVFAGLPFGQRPGLGRAEHVLARLDRTRLRDDHLLVAGARA
ncbi:hypothetical protein [Streptomyces justiciae]|uniref:hypothetical protein n=1 Tax=Streptomyces justiciae TaxID=2780140 RepID=UPI002117A34D|nr:hypothetical protein [Streptomyces justiciae]MCW8379830.1 hypothetical protein [Streptomyces justiciae]